LGGDGTRNAKHVDGRGEGDGEKTCGHRNGGVRDPRRARVSRFKRVEICRFIGDLQSWNLLRFERFTKSRQN
jgi:hypothetical protein